MQNLIHNSNNYDTTYTDVFVKDYNSDNNIEINLFDIYSNPNHYQINNNINS